MKKILAKIIVLGAMLSGCVPPKFRPTALFDTEKANLLLADGQNSIRGSALMRQIGGGVVTCAGREVRLVPATSYADEWMQALYGGGEHGYNPAFGGKAFTLTDDYDVQQYLQLTKKTICDAQGGG